MENISVDLSLKEILLQARLMGASDVHLLSGSAITLRINGSLTVVSPELLSIERCSAILQEGLSPEDWATLCASGDLELVLDLAENGRYRVAAARHRQGTAFVARVIDKEIRSFEASGLPVACRSLLQWTQGMVLIAGPSGCGKTSTLLTLMELINQTRAEHIITIENPIEYVFTSKLCQISQRQVGMHTQSQDAALRAALREDPDIIVVGELRDLRTCQLAISAAETGHLVFATMNTVDAAQTITALINSFPADEQPIIRNMVAESLRGVVCQQLVPRSDGKGMVAAYEVLMLTPAVASMIKSGRTKQLNNVITTGKNEGMVLLDDSLRALLAQGVISAQDAASRAVNPSGLKAAATVKGSPYA